MGKIDSSIEIPEHRDAVWEAISSPADYEKWQTIHSKWKGDAPEGFSEGSQITEVVEMMGMPNTITWTVDRFDSPNELSISETGMADIETEGPWSIEEISKRLGEGQPVAG